MENIKNENKGDVFLSLQNLVKVYPNGEKAVYNFNLDIERNELIVIVGPSGCGKSTTLRMVAGLEDISSGDIYLQGELLNYKPSSERNMAIVFQSYALYPQMNVYDNIAFPLTINKYNLPRLNSIFKANAEIENILGCVPFFNLAEAIRNISNSKIKTSVKEEQTATALNISLTAAKLLYKVFSEFKQVPLEELNEKEVTEAIRAQLTPLMEAEREKLSEKNINLNENFYEVDGSGNVVTEQRKYSPYEIKMRVFETAEKLDLIPYLDKLPKELSGGQMQRVALGRAIIKNVPIFMMDEPLSNLDAKLRLTMRSEIVKLHNKINATTIYVTHDQTEAMTMATRIVVMSRGFIQQIGTPEEVYNNPANIFVAKFIGSPTMNMFGMNYNYKTGCLERGDIKINIGDSFKARIDKHYADKIKLFEGMQDSFADKEREYILKILSATGEYRGDKKQIKKKGIIKNIVNLIEKRKQKNVVVDKFAYEKEVFEKKLGELKNNAASTHQITVGIRPERISVKRGKGSAKESGFTVKPSVCELLGGEYNIHFDFFDMDMVCKIDANEKITVNDDLFVSFSPDDLYFFDTVTGDRI